MTNTILSCSILAVIVFGIQLTLCLKTSGKVAKRIPVYFIILLRRELPPFRKKHSSRYTVNTPQ